MTTHNIESFIEHVDKKLLGKMQKVAIREAQERGDQASARRITIDYLVQILNTPHLELNSVDFMMVCHYNEYVDKYPHGAGM